MSKIQPVVPKYQQNNKKMNRVNNFNHKNGVSFSGSLKPEQVLAQGVATKIDETFAKTKIGKGINYLSKLLNKNEGEVQSQVINAVFTTTLAPLFIAFNPFSTQDKKTKEYTALRQPISAVIAITGGYALTTWTNSIIEKWGSEGYLGDFVDVRIKPDNNYLKAQFKRELKSKKTPEELKEFLSGLKVENASVDDLKKGGSAKRKYLKEAKNAYIKSINDSRKEIFNTLAVTNPENIIVDEATGTIKFKDSNKIICKDIPNLTTQAQLDEHLSKNNIFKLKVSDILKSEFKMEFYPDGRIKPYVMVDGMVKTKAMDFFEKLGIKGFKEADLVKALDEIRAKNKTVENLKKTWNVHSSKSSHKVQATVEEQSKMIKRMIDGAIGENLANEKKLTLGQLFHKLDKIDDEGIKGFDDLQKFFDLSVADAMDELKKTLNHLKVADGHEKGGIKFFANKTKEMFTLNMTEAKIEKAASYFKNFKGYTGIFFNIFIVALTCTALNWIYPRLVERLFPSLVKNDAPKGGNK